MHVALTLLCQTSIILMPRLRQESLHLASAVQTSLANHSPVPMNQVKKRQGPWGMLQFRVLQH